MTNNFDFLKQIHICIVKYSEDSIIKSIIFYDFNSFYNTHVTSDLTRQILSLNEYIVKPKIKTAKELSF